MMKKYCPYCGKLMSDFCECEIIAAQEHEAFINDYEESPFTHDGWAMQDRIDQRRYEQ